ncbi:MAG: hypothetical protein BGO26_03315 [Actinobacteria bacterium 69-20]|nr:hypothetical protein [Actinomycetota bacterium]OJV23869.1 MAG: hypothetical protein BGO26_03315 [Actinobacteria bacterium 69-20]
MVTLRGPGPQQLPHAVWLDTDGAGAAEAADVANTVQAAAAAMVPTKAVIRERDIVGFLSVAGGGVE